MLNDNLTPIVFGPEDQVEIAETRKGLALLKEVIESVVTEPIYGEDYTCGCGIYVHPARRIGRNMGQAIHISDCPYAAPAVAKGML